LSELDSEDDDSVMSIRACQFGVVSIGLSPEKFEQTFFLALDDKLAVHIASRRFLRGISYLEEFLGQGQMLNQIHGKCRSFLIWQALMQFTGISHPPICWSLNLATLVFAT